MAGAVTENECHAHVDRFAAEAAPAGLAPLEAESEED